MRGNASVQGLVRLDAKVASTRDLSQEVSWQPQE